MARTGRPKKALKVSIAARVLGPVDGDKLEKGMPGEHALPAELMAGMPIEQRFTELGIRVAERLEDVRESIEKDRSKAVAEFMPWLHKMRPDGMVIELEQRLHLNERIVAFLLKEVATHMALSAKIESELKQARNKAIMEFMKVPQGLQDFVLKLHAAGLLSASVKDISKSSVDAVTALLNGEVDPELLEAVGIGRSGRRITAEDAERALEEADRMVAEHRESMVEEAIEMLPAVIEPVVPEGFGDDWDYGVGPLPPEYWSTVQEFAIPYSWEYRMALPEEEDSVLGMPLPEAHSWSALISWDRHFEEIALDPIRTKRGAMNNVRDLMAVKREMDPNDVEMNLVKTWLLLLAARTMTEDECDRMFEPGFFEGVVMPCPATGAGVVRQLVRKGE